MHVQGHAGSDRPAWHRDRILAAPPGPPQPSAADRLETNVATSPLPASPVITATSPDFVSRAAWKALIGSALGYAMDGFDLLILGFMLGAIRTGLGLQPAQAASLVTATLIGAVIGGIVFGLLSDRV